METSRRGRRGTQKPLAKSAHEAEKPYHGSLTTRDISDLRKHRIYMFPRHRISALAHHIAEVLGNELLPPYLDVIGSNQLVNMAIPYLGIHRSVNHVNFTLSGQAAWQPVAPIHHVENLGDRLGENSRYVVVHKLGHGGFATVWLCRDTQQLSPRYVALKILMAETSAEDCPEILQSQLKFSKDIKGTANQTDRICLPLEKFDIEGPNGTHYCFVYPLLGPKVSYGLCRSLGDPDRVLRDISFKVVQGIASLHEHGLCHGDLTPSNVLHRISSLDDLTEDAVLAVVGKPSLNKVLDAKSQTKEHNNPSAPQYLVYPINWHTVDPKYIASDPYIIDFGESFRGEDPPEDLGIPGPYRSPELILESKAGYGSDLWALGCTLFEIRTGRKLFSLFDDEDDDYLDAMVEILGPMPELWWSTTWAGRRRVFLDQADELGRAVKTSGDVPYAPPDGVVSSVHPSVAEGARSLSDKLAPGVWYLSDEAEPNGTNNHREISVHEREILADLLGKLMAYRPQARLSAKEALQHEWFKL